MAKQQYRNGRWSSQAAFAVGYTTIGARLAQLRAKIDEMAGFVEYAG
jgi:hypothetical protein